MELQFTNIELWIVRGWNNNLAPHSAIIFLSMGTVWTPWWNPQLSIIIVSPCFITGLSNRSRCCTASVKQFNSSSPFDAPCNISTWKIPSIFTSKLTVKVAFDAYFWISIAFRQKLCQAFCGSGSERFYQITTYIRVTMRCARIAVDQCIVIRRWRRSFEDIFDKI